MPTFSATKAYADDTVLYENDLNLIISATQTFVNTPLLDSDNIQAAGINTVNLVDASITVDKLAAEVTSRFVPIGTILPWYSYSATLTFSTAVYAYCDGSTATITGLGAVTLPDMSDRFLLGFGTEGGEDMDTATWAITAVGDVSHTISVKAHTHTVGTLKFATFQTTYASSTGTSFFGYTSTGGTSQMFSLTDIPEGGAGAATDEIFGVHTATATFYTKTPTGTSDNPTDTADIQPRSIRVRYIIRIA